MSDAERTKWDARYASARAVLREPSAFLVSLADVLPSAGRALDVGGGGGRNGVWLAERGLDTTIVDISRAGLDIAAARAAEVGVRVGTIVADLDRDPLPAGPWDLIVDIHFLQRRLFGAFHDAMSEGSLLVFCHPTERNLERHSKPSARHLLADGELPSLVQAFETVRYFEGWTDAGRHEAQALLRK